MRIAPPEGSMNFFDHDAELNGRFDRFYAELWQRGALDQATKEVGRLRNARITDCGI
ncbi:MAG: hypothetical protein R8F63_16850 [Acidimicrobiales bacterium]|nr:hypothetical protein [Acidimicrobiales bacterium]